MNKIKTLLMAVVAICAASLTSCTDKMDWDVDPAYDRLFGIQSCDVTPDANSITLEFKAPAGADGYQIQWATSEIADESEDAPGDMIVKSTPAVIEGLMGDTEYFIRMRAVSDTKKSSKWIKVTKSDGSFYKTLKEQIMFPVAETDREQDAITVTWDASKEVTNLVVFDAEGNEVQNIELGPDAKAAGRQVVTDLQPLTTYVFNIMNGAAQRGTCTASTTAAVPKSDYIFFMPEDMDNIDNDVMRQIADQAMQQAEPGASSYSATIVIPAGKTIDMRAFSESGEAASVKIPDGMAVTFFGAAGEKPTIKLTSKTLDIAGNHAFIRFQDLDIEDGGAQYFINQSAACTIEEISFSNVNFKFNSGSRSIVRVQGSGAVNIASISVDNSLMFNYPDNYFLFDFRNNSQNIGKFTMTNATMFNVARVLTNTGNDMAGGINISDCTFQDMIASGRYFIDCNGKASNIVMDRIVLGTVKSGGRGVRTTGTILANGFRTKDSAFSSNDFPSAVGFAPDEELTAADIFVNAAEGNLTLKIEDKFGDPRWYKPAE